MNLDKSVDFLSKKGWDYDGNTKGNDPDDITFAYSKGTRGAIAWLGIFNVSSKQTKQISYQIHIKSFYLSIKAELPKFGYSLLNSKNENGTIVTTYKSNKYIVKIKVEPDDEGTTAYMIYLIPNNGLY